MADQASLRIRITSVVAASCIALACGTNYAYSAWGPQFAKKMNLSATQSNIIGTAGNMGMYATAIPAGYLIDSRGPRPAVLIGSIALGAGYLPIHQAFIHGPGSMGVVLFCFFYFLTGLGSCTAFVAAMKISALNWPGHRGTATAFPLSCFGLSAFFFSLVAGIAFPNNTGGYLLLLSIGPFIFVFVPLFFLHTPSTSASYSALATSEDEQTVENGRPNTRRSKSQESQLTLEQRITSQDVTGLALLSRLDFWQLWIMLGLLAGIGLMTINNIGNDAYALWSHYDDSVSKSFIMKQQLAHVSIISLASFSGRLLSGIGSDVIVKRLQGSRFWCLTMSAAIFLVAQFLATRIQNPNELWAISALTGLGYGALFGVYPALVVDAFGLHGFSMNWGFIMLSSVLSGNILNIVYGATYDHHSTILPGGDRDCPDGIKCYVLAYWIALALSALAILLSLWCIRDDHARARQPLETDDEDRT